jgi:predicted RNase H-like nuclease (RuvC/YqgF family)
LIQLQTTQLHTLPADIQNLDLTIANLKAAQEAPSSLPMLNLPLHSTNTLLSEKESELARLDRQIAELQSTLPDKKRAVAALKADLEPIESRKRSAITDAQEAQKKRGQHSLAQDLDERGKWLKSADAGLRLMLQI